MLITQVIGLSHPATRGVGFLTAAEGALRHFPSPRGGAFERGGEGEVQDAWVGRDSEREAFGRRGAA
jgi:hypothetical protein